jgi:hypothetical protein
MKKQPKITVISKRRVSDKIYASFDKLRQKVSGAVKNLVHENNVTGVRIPVAYNFIKENTELDEDVYSDMDGIGFDLYGNPVKCF